MNPDADETLDSHVQRGDKDRKPNDCNSEDDCSPEEVEQTGDDSFELAPSLDVANIDTSQSIGETLDSVGPAPATPSADTSLDQTLDSAAANPDESSDDDFSVHQSVAPDSMESATASFTGAITKIGRYETVRVLGEGAFGCVFEAHDPQLDRRVAVKVAKSINSTNAIERFLREARSAAQLRHPNIIPVHEYGKVDDQHIIVYEYIEGETLKSYISRNQPLPLPETLRLVRLIAEGLDYAHSKGIIHRDMKPDNVMIDASGQPHIADFGCARSMEADVSLTMDGSILGTPTYMSPEQASGRSNTADGRTDIWSLGVMLYEMVAGKKPFSGKLTDLLFWIRNHDPPPLRTHNASAPADVETICTKCLQRELPDRFSTAQELADEIERFERGEPIQSRPVTLLRRLTLWRKRNPTVANLLAAVAVSLVAGITATSYYAFEAWREKDERIRSQLVSVSTAKATEVPTLLRSLQPSKSTVLPILRERFDELATTPSEGRRLLTALLYFETDQETKARLSGQLAPRLLDAEADLLTVAREAIVDDDGVISNEQLWPILLNQTGTASVDQRLRAACLLAKLDPDSASWQAVNNDLSGILVNMNLLESTRWLPTLKPVREQLRPALQSAFSTTEEASRDQRDRSAALLATLFDDQTESLTELVETASPTQLAWLLPPLQASPDKAVQKVTARLHDLKTSPESEQTVVAKANLIIAMIQMGSVDYWSYLDRHQHISIAAEIIERLGPSAGFNPASIDALTHQLANWRVHPPAPMASLILAMGQFSDAQIARTRRNSLIHLLLSVFDKHPDVEVHSAARWLLQKWNATDQLAAAERKLRSPEPLPGHRWHVDLAGNTFAVFEPVPQFSMGISPAQMERARVQSSDSDGEQQHLRRIPRRFGICIHEVTSKQFVEFETYLVQTWKQKLATLGSEDQTAAQQLKARIEDIPRRQKRRIDSSPDAPVVDVSWLRALAYCRWLSDKHATGYCLPSVARLQKWYQDKTDVPLLQKHLRRPGYRLPTAAEWEYACRANTPTLRPSGIALSRLESYAWYGADRNFSPQPVGLLKPNGFGLFDCLGNVSEWCLTWHREVLPGTSLAISDDLVASDTSDPIWPDIGESQTGWQSDAREHRGASYQNDAGDLRTSKRFRLRPFKGLNHLGFRLARTYPIEQTDE
jgi:serine/threonine protein kinase/formylglycine-generating enzyme required for sulfatase activity